MPRPASTPNCLARHATAKRRRPGTLRWTACWAGLLLALGCGQSALREPLDPAQPQGSLLELPPRAVSQAGEVLHAQVELLGLQLGTLETSSCPARGALPATMQTQITGASLVNFIRKVGGDARTELAASRSPRVSEYNFREGDILRHYRVEYQPGRFHYLYDNGGQATRTGQGSVPEGASPQDLHSAVGLLRAWRPRLGERAHFYVVAGRRLWRVDVTSVGPQVIETQGVSRLTHRIDGEGVRLWDEPDTSPRQFSLWLSDDADRVPVRVQADSKLGAVTMTLTEREQAPASCQQPSPTPALSEASDREQPATQSVRFSPQVATSAPRVGSAWQGPQLSTTGSLEKR
jgi:uncharacterized protein DUF3108